VCNFINRIKNFDAFSSPIGFLPNIYYYGTSKIFHINAEYIEFVGGTDTTDATFNPDTSVYTFTRSLWQTYKDVKYVRAALSSWSSKTQYFGFDTAVYYETDPVSEIKFNITIMPQNSFAKLGFTVVIVSSDFNLVLTLHSFNLTSINTWHNLSTPISSSSSAMVFF
jgi:hypothetical protein